MALKVPRDSEVRNAGPADNLGDPFLDVNAFMAFSTTTDHLNTDRQPLPVPAVKAENAGYTKKLTSLLELGWLLNRGFLGIVDYKS